MQECKMLLTRGLHQAFPTDPHNTLWSVQSLWLPPLPVDLAHYEVVISWQLSPSVDPCVLHRKSPENKFYVGVCHIKKMKSIIL